MIKQQPSPSKQPKAQNASPANSTQVENSFENIVKNRKGEYAIASTHNMDSPRMIETDNQSAQFLET
jgi:hypothetical protein